MAKCPLCGKEGFEGQIPIYEKLSEGDALIISRKGDTFLVAENNNGDICIREVDIDK